MKAALATTAAIPRPALPPASTAQAGGALLLLRAGLALGPRAQQTACLPFPHRTPPGEAQGEHGQQGCPSTGRAFLWCKVGLGTPVHGPATHPATGSLSSAELDQGVSSSTAWNPFWRAGGVWGGHGWELRHPVAKGPGGWALEAHVLSKGSSLWGREGEPAGAWSRDQGN